MRLLASQTRRLGALAGLTALTGLGACSDNPVEPPPPLEPLIVSHPITQAGRAAGAHVAASLVASPGDEVVYVSLLPGTAPAGSTATIHRVGDAGLIYTALLDGGFDPVPVPAQAGDSVDVVVKDAGGATVLQRIILVRATRPPVIVRTDPPPQKRDVPLNANIVIVFSQPIAGGTLTPSSVHVLRGTSAVAGGVSLLAGSGTIAAFTPAAPLDPNTAYELVVNTAVTDVEGTPLTAGVTVPFTTGQSSTGPPALITVSPDTVYMIGGTYQMTGTVRDASGNVLIGQPVTWSSSDPNGLTLSSTGLVTGLATGAYTVTARLNELTGAALVVVVTGPPASVDISPRPATVGAAGDTIILTATVRDARGRMIRYPSVTWTSSAPSVATVAPYSIGDVAPGLATVTGVTLGDARISATSGTASDTVSVTVVAPPPVASLTVSPASVSLLLHMTKRLSAVARDANGKVLPGRAISWTSDDPAAATVDGTGLVTAVGGGSAAVIATSEGMSDTAAVTVTILTLASVTAGDLHSCAVTTNGAAYCWGHNEYGQLGDGSLVSRAIPTAVAGGLTFATVATWEFHSCGVTTGAAAYCWGDNVNGKLGDGSTASSTVPVAVTGGLRFSAVATGWNHTCGLTVSGAAYCWGDNADGELGDGSTTSRLVPVAVTGGLTFSAVTTWGIHTCGLTTTGAAYCWGSNFAGQLGDGSTNSSSVPVAVTSGLTFSALSAGRFHTCGVIATGAAYCWGDNGSSQLGDGTTTMQPTPVAVSGGLTFVVLAGGDYHTCGLTASGAAYCWGRNSENELGDGGSGIGRRPFPTGVAGGLTFSAISAGGFHTCALATAGTAYCWGYNAFGELGNGTGTDSSVPVRVLGQP